MNRRNLLKKLGGTAVVAGAGGTALIASSGSAVAVASQHLGTTGARSDDGTVEYVAIFGDSVVDWEGFDTPAQYFSIDISLEIVQDWDGQTRAGPTNIHSTGLVDLDNDNWGNYDESLSGSGTRGTIESGIGLTEDGNHDPTIDWHIVGTDPDDYGLPQNPMDASHLTVEEDGNKRKFRLVMRSTYTWYDADENQIFDETFETTLNVNVKNIESQATASDGDGEDGGVAAPKQD